MAETTNVHELVTGVKITKTMSIKPDGESNDKKKITLVIDFDGVSFASVIEGAVKTDIIRAQASLRKLYDTLTDGQTIERKYAAPPVATVSKEQGEAMVINEMKNLDPSEHVEYLKNLAKKHGIELDI